MPSTRVDQAAAVCYRWNGGQLEFLLVLTSGKRRIFPKGKIEQGEIPQRTAQREAREEAGVAGAVSEEPLTVFRHLKRSGKEKSVAAYLLRVENTLDPLEPHRDPQWYTPDQAIAALAAHREAESARELQRVIREACAALGSAVPPSARPTHVRER